MFTSVCVWFQSYQQWEAANEAEKEAVRNPNPTTRSALQAKKKNASEEASSNAQKRQKVRQSALTSVI